MTKTYRGIRLLDKSAYIQQLTAAVVAVPEGSHVAVATFNFDPKEPLVARLVDALCAAAHRNVSVSLAVDAYNFLLHDKHKTPGPWFYQPGRTPQREPYRTCFAALERLRQAGVTVGVTNTPAHRFSIPQRGRSHIKAAVVGEQVFVGSCNLNSLRLDLMLTWRSQEIATWLYPHLRAMATTEQASTAFDNQDWSIPAGDTTTLLVDAGLPHQSVIFEHALELIDNAHDWIFLASQYFAHGITGQRLQAARERGVKVYTMYNHPSKHGLVEGTLLQSVLWRERLRLPRVAFAGQLARSKMYLHAKVLATERGAIVGSHNYVPTGTNFGTAEIALEVGSPAFAREATVLIFEIAELLHDPAVAAFCNHIRSTS